MYSKLTYAYAVFLQVYLIHKQTDNFGQKICHCVISLSVPPLNRSALTVLMEQSTSTLC